jgi:hypothetical protein
MKKNRQKPLYKTGKNVAFVLSNMWKWDKLLVTISIAQAPLKVVLVLSGLYIVRLVISLIESKSDFGMFIIQFSVFTLVVLF